MGAFKGREVVSRAIILRSQTIGEDDVLADFLTPDLGRLWGRARHGRKSRKRFGTLLESFNILTIRFRDKGHFVDLEEAALDRPLLRLRESMERLGVAYYLVDLIREMVPERNPEQGLFDLTEGSLAALESGQTTRSIVENFERNFLEILGYKPEFKNCLRCQRPREGSSRFFFVFKEGGVYCADCVPVDLEHESVTEGRISALLSRFIEYQLGRPPRSRKFFDTTYSKC